MPIHRSKNNPVNILNNLSLSLSAKGLYCMMLIGNVDDKAFSECFDYDAFNELVSAGYLKEDDVCKKEDQ